MATMRYPDTGVIINEMNVRRRRASYKDEVTINLMSFRGLSTDKIAHLMGMPRIEVWKLLDRTKMTTARSEAMEMHLSTLPKGFRPTPARQEVTATAQGRFPGI